MTDTRKCPYCSEEIRSEAIKCRFCGSHLDRRGPMDWYRSRSEKMIAGVCGGLAEQFGLPTALVRLGFVLTAIFWGGMGLVLYVILWFVMPLEREDEWSLERSVYRAGDAEDGSG